MPDFNLSGFCLFKIVKTEDKPDRLLQTDRQFYFYPVIKQIENYLVIHKQAAKGNT